MRWRIVVYFICTTAVLLPFSDAHALWTTNIPAADASLLEIAPNNSIGGLGWVVSGRVQNGPVCRALYRFDVSELPTNAVILSVALQVDCTGQSSEPMCVTGTTFGLHRMLRAWGEGTNLPVSNPGGQGAPANVGDATWNHAFFPTNSWSAPGGQADVDFAAFESGFQYVNTPDESPYRFNTTPELVEDVQSWIRVPSSNFGWMLKSEDELTICNAKRFASRESTNSLPRLEVEYSVPPRFDSARRTGNQFEMRFTPWPEHGYTLQYRTNLGAAPWLTLTNIGITTNAAPITLTDTVGTAQRYYRLLAY